MKTLLLTILLIATPAMAQNTPVQIVNTGENSAIMMWVDGQGVPRSQPITVDRTMPGSTLITTPGSAPNTLIDQGPLGGRDGSLLTD
jgi:hypothetical protein